MKNRVSAIIICLFLSVASVCATAQENYSDSIQISLLTCSPGPAIYELYGHTAIRVTNHTTGNDIVFNYGLFDFSSPNFIWRFTLGKTDYLLGAEYYKNFERSYTQRGSEIFQQDLHISKAESEKLFQLLSTHAKPENRVYRYNFLDNNCATMALDKIEEAVNGKIKYTQMDTTTTYRQLLHKYNMVSPWSSFGTDLVIGADADTTIQNRQFAFAPLELMELLAHATVTDSAGNVTPLVSEAYVVNNPQNEVIFGNYILTPTQVMWIVLLTTIFISLINWHKKRISWWFDIVLIGIQGLAGIIISFLFFFSEHPTVGSNYLIIPFNPIPLFFIPFIIINARKKQIDTFTLCNGIITLSFAVLSSAIPQHIQTATLLFITSIAYRCLSNTLLILYVKYVVPKRDAKYFNPRYYAVIIVLFGIPASAQIIRPVQNETEPKLIIGITVDQLDSEYYEKLLPLFSDNGLKELWNNGYNRPNSTFDFDEADIASATASIYTGASPLQHGIVASRWMDRKTLNVGSLAEDNSYDGTNTFDKCSPKRLLATNLADELYLTYGEDAHICAIGIDKEQVIFSAGHEADYALWLNENAEWCSSSYYNQIPEWCSAIDYGTNNHPEWIPSYPTGAYIQKSADERYKPFSYIFKKKDMWDLRTSPIANDRVTDLALTAIDELEMGKDNNTDMLMLSYYAGNYQGQPSTLYSLEQQDIYLRLDKNIKSIIEYVEKNIGLDNTLIFLTSTGQKPKQAPDLSKTRIPNGTVSMERVTALLNLFLSAKYGDGKYIETYHLNHIYINSNTIDKNDLALHEIIESCVDFLYQVTGVKSIIAQRDLAFGIHNEQTIRKRNATHSYYSGDLIIEVNPGWSITDEDCDIRYYYTPQASSIPLIMYGNGIHAEIDRNPVSISILASTVAHIARINTPNACSAPALKNLK